MQGFSQHKRHVCQGRVGVFTVMQSFFFLLCWSKLIYSPAAPEFINLITSYLVKGSGKPPSMRTDDIYMNLNK